MRSSICAPSDTSKVAVKRIETAKLRSVVPRGAWGAQATTPDVVATTRRPVEVTAGRSSLPAAKWREGLRRRWWIGIVYVAATLYGSVSFLHTAGAVLGNDIYWSNFNATSGGVFVANAFNSLLSLSRNSTTVQLTDAIFAQSSDPKIAFSTHYARQLQYNRLTTIEDGIAGMRLVSGVNAPFVFTQYCWLDFDRRWSLAHTEKRAERCWHDYVSNAAVYMESMLRNIQWADFDQVWGPAFMSGIGGPLHELVDGAAFFEDVKRNASTSLAEEARYWRSKGMTHYTLQYHNLGQVGVDEKVALVNAFGIQSLFTIKKSEYVDRWAIQTTIKMNWGPSNDLWAVIANHTRLMGMSLIRNSSNFFEYQNITMEQVLIEDGDVPFPFPPNQLSFRAAVGPYGSVDMIWTMFPPELAELVRTTKMVVLEAAMASPESLAAYARSGASSLLNLSPKVWTDGGWTYTMANPLCTNAFAAGYVLQQFAFDDGCQPISEVVHTTPFHFVFAVLVMDLVDSVDIDSFCSVGTLQMDVCTSGFENAIQFVPRERQKVVLELARTAHMAMAPLNVTIIQFVQRQDSNQTTQALLVEPVLSVDQSAPWNALGWCLALEWVLGLREVVSFQGDNGKLTIMSSVTLPSAMAPNKAEISTTTAFYLHLSMQYVTAVLVGVALMVLVFGAKDHFDVAPANLLEFNRVAGIVWVGRPMLFLRGLVAICILSSSRPEMKIDGQLTWMEDTSRTLITNMLTAGESTWLLYVALDVVLLFIRGHWERVALASHILAFVAVATLQMLSPVHHRVVIDPKCQYSALDSYITCVSGAVYVGSAIRLLTILGITSGVAFCCYIAVRFLTTRRSLRDDCMALPGVAQEMFARSGWIANGNWHVDRASAAMAGLPAWHVGNMTRVININTWSVLEVSRASKEADRPQIQRAICLRKLKSHCH